MKKITATLGLLTLALFLTQCGVSNQIKEAKTFGDCRYAISSVDSIFLAGTDVREFRNIKSVKDLDPTKYPQLGLALLRKKVPLDLRVNLDIVNPTNRLAAINQLEYIVLLSKSEVFKGVLNRRIEVYPGTGSTQVPVQLSTNAYDLIANDQTRDSFVAMIQSLSGKDDSKPAVLTVKIKPTLAVGDKAVNYPGYITFEQEITPNMVIGK
ncbi:hypothetical protein [Persicitalea jodogahamensis]|uniref:Late embryogenesis abundant protein LEA-2 subgroup domain-containing protein n=1 Tax=Persicitalea jodogahamensis TaxID=402147 RepID=A0A8J3DAZ0_9BACT|nr:hypothetical protein [Persicitalea jodogahamensis]GHB76734.1 hypothetical protein GCM10007390_33380 [Persicitalea jodogahamensis]